MARVRAAAAPRRPAAGSAPGRGWRRPGRILAPDPAPHPDPWPDPTPPASVYLAARGYAAQLAEELRRAGLPPPIWHGRLALSPHPPVPAAWALEVWTAPRLLPAPSIAAGADQLRAIQRNWALVPIAHHRRSRLIEARLPPVKARPLRFPEPPPASHLGAWTLLRPDLILASPTKTSPFPQGEARFVEDREGPPSRAYLKLWAGLTRLGAHPAPGELCLDLGAAPGGWSWALARLGAQVVAVDKAPLDPRVAALPGVSWRQESAFALAPEPVDWLFSDVICYPPRLLALVRRWLDAGVVRRGLVVTIKFQGSTDHETAAAFAAIPGGLLFHSAQNRHELTFAWLRPAEGGGKPAP
ncbi:MAG: SAM-dependent methyltransferase [Rhodovarius sp.]|nr:SAM-dependent methyltransferase [Rhodovarius sp.]